MNNPVRRAASLIICRQAKKLTSFFDYEVLMLTRQDNMQSFNSVLAFPGGKCDIDLDTKIANALNIKDLVKVTAIRQCFQEIGLFFPQQPLLQLQKLEKLKRLKLQYIAAQLNLAQINHTQVFLELSKIMLPKLDFTPFVRLVTVPMLKKRYDASFYLNKINQHDFINFLKYTQGQRYLHSSSQLSICQQFKDFCWKNPIQVLKQYKNKQLKLAQPQYIMLSIMSQFQKYNQLEQFIKQCSYNPINTLPNIVSIIKNQGFSKDKYPYAATLVGDHQFPYENIFKNQSNPQLIAQLKNAYENVPTIKDSPSKVRLLFKEPKHFFDDQYDVECNVQGSVLGKMPNSEELKILLKDLC